MLIPVKSRLALTWETATLRKHLYSRVFQGKLGEAPASSWMKAELVQGEKDTFVINKHQYKKTKKFHPAQRTKERVGDTFTYKQAVAEIKKFEAEMKAQNELLSQKQPFRHHGIKAKAKTRKPAAATP
jgi:hypothetical protein